MENLNQVVAALQQQDVIAYPTEAVFGVGCDPDSETAVNKLLALKQRPVEKGLILIAANYEQLAPYVDDSTLDDEQKARIFCLLARPGYLGDANQARCTTFLDRAVRYYRGSGD